MEIISSEKHSSPFLNHVAEQHSSSWVEIDTKALEHNIWLYKKCVAPAQFAPVIKSNAYGHGIELVARVCDAYPGVDRICVVSLREAVMLRTLGIKKPIIVLSILDGALQDASRHDIAVTIYDRETAHTLNSIGKRYGTRIAVHIKVDTGLSRLGVLAHEAVNFVRTLAQLPYLFIEGIFTHFADAESTQQPAMKKQLTSFQLITHELENLGITIPFQHTTCSAAITAQSATHRTHLRPGYGGEPLARAGIGIYGLWPSQENKELTTAHYPEFALKPALTWKTRIMHLKEVPAGSSVGYDCTFTTKRPTRIATLPVGYWDGYDRKLSSNSCVLINGQLVPVIGRIAMNLMMVDVTDAQASVDDEVTLLGSHAGVTAQDLAQRCGTINYEIVTRINPLLPRVAV